MRLWSIHPKYLDSRGLVALWRESLLAKHVIEGKTKGYKNHSQLARFRNSPDPLGAINYYLHMIHIESEARGYHFDRSKFQQSTAKNMEVTSGQMQFEVGHLFRKLEKRDKNKLEALRSVKFFEAHPLFTIVEGVIENWEIVK
ncbi:MAG: pyrimidine dimer DNA glycosylase/endonuclease V [Ignavibacteriota bacterium]